MKEGLSFRQMNKINKLVREAHSHVSTVLHGKGLDEYLNKLRAELITMQNDFNKKHGTKETV